MTQPSAESTGQRILVVDDDPALAEMLQLVLHKERFVTDWCASGSRALDVFDRFKPDLILLDLMLPGRNGIDVCREVRRVSGVPIIMLTARSDTQDVVSGLEAGADDYVSKPFKSKELVARIRTRLRQPLEAATDTESDVTSIGDLVIDVRAHQVTRGGQEIPLTPLEFDVLVALARRPHDVFSRDALLEEVWGYRHAADTRLVNVHVQRLRSKIERDPEHPSIVITVRGVGYRAGSGDREEN
ncbi:MtrAB system response regulator MtrA [Acidipropionibacterium jensenii]|uniref:DNA-binding response regulator MtrA n=2 Tax=Acidipropionibacterium jensenii TaxID=1749 RepID=A0A3S4W7T4_9ACTN|nr:MtrAB system response regulator MtrA [Acidipropionibacterium jensenii]VEI02784.1 DNA-binding response regulator mtrA [Acidipropionibacterium jensenii]